MLGNGKSKQRLSSTAACDRRSAPPATLSRNGGIR